MKPKRRKYGKVYIVYQWSTRNDKYVFSVESRDGDSQWVEFFDSIEDGDLAAMKFADTLAVR
jgi:hypothetical protein